MTRDDMTPAQAAVESGKVVCRAAPFGRGEEALGRSPRDPLEADLSQLLLKET